MYSEIDSKGELWVACSECEKGGNGSDVEMCRRGWKVKEFNGSGCFAGTLIQKHANNLQPTTYESR
jgi:hypothetical protein